jgi:hypothetical protein
VGEIGSHRLRQTLETKKLPFNMRWRYSRAGGSNAAGTAIGGALSMRFDRRLAELNWRSNGWNSIYQGGKFRQDPLLADSGHKSASNCSARHQPFSS